MVNIRTTRQSQTHESTGDNASSSSPHSAPPALMTERDINVTVRGQRHGHMKGVGHLLTRLRSQAGASSATPSISFVRGLSSTPAQSAPTRPCTSASYRTRAVISRVHTDVHYNTYPTSSCPLCRRFFDHHKDQLKSSLMMLIILMVMIRGLQI